MNLETGAKANSNNTSQQRVSRPVLFYFAIACLLSWAIWIPLGLSRNQLLPIRLPLPLYFAGAFGPALAALLTSWYLKTSHPVTLIRNLFSFRLPVIFYILATMIPVVAYLVSAGLVIACSGDLGDFQFNSLLSVAAIFFSFSLIVVGEELGWRGFALPQLQTTRTAHSATLLVWLMWGIWHIPAFFVSGVFESLLQLTLAAFAFMVLLLPVTYVFTWLHNYSQGKTILAVILHASVAASSGLSNVAVVRPWIFFPCYACAFAVIAVGLYHFRPTPAIGAEPGRELNPIDENRAKR